MGKITGFLELERVAGSVRSRRTSACSHYREFILALDDDAASKQGARCMDCGIPFCQSGCPVNNIIPDWNDLVYRQALAATRSTSLHSTNNFPEFTGRVCPAPCEAACTLNINDDPVGIKSIEHCDHRQGLGGGLGRAAAARARRPASASRSSAPGPPGLACAQQLARAGHDVVAVREERPHRRAAALRHPRFQDGEAR